MSVLLLTEEEYRTDPFLGEGSSEYINNRPMSRNTQQPDFRSQEVTDNQSLVGVKERYSVKVVL